MKKLHDLLVLRITQKDEKGELPLIVIVGRGGVKWTTEFSVDKGYIDIFVPPQGVAMREPYIIEVETGYDLDCGQIIRKFWRLKKAMTKPALHIGFGPLEETRVTERVEPKLAVVIPEDFTDFIPTFKNEKISVFLWEGNLEWECKKCGNITLGDTPWKPSECSSCGKKERSLRLVGLEDLKVIEVYRVP